jgi:ribosomal subunit interface protein
MGHAVGDLSFLKPQRRGFPVRHVRCSSLVMQVYITFRAIPHSDAIEACVRQHAAKLETLSGRITGCHVAVESPHRHKQTGKQFRVRVDLVVPGSEIVVSHVQGDDVANNDAYAAVDEAFDRISRRLEDHIQRQRGEVKHRESAYRTGRVAKVWSYEGFGFTETEDGGEVYFHRNAVTEHAFDKVAIGSAVRFIEEAGDKGPQASTVVLVA